MQGSSDAFDRWSRRFDVALAYGSLVALGPLLALLALLVRLEGAGPVFCGRRRIGRGGQLFESFRFRTSSTPKITASERDVASFEAAARRGRRLSGVGAFLEETGLDQLPELFNVLRGEMSLVGPRPLDAVEASAASVTRFVNWGLRPGITGLWRIRRRSDPNDWEQAHLDEAYARRRSLWLYLRILAETVPAALARRGWY